MSKAHIALALTVAFALNSLAIYSTIRLLKKYSAIKEGSQAIDRSFRKAYISKKKHIIASTQVKYLRSKIFRLSLYQFLVPLAAFLASSMLYIPLALLFLPREDPTIVYLDRPCIAPIPIQFPAQDSERNCYMQITWIFFLTFLLYLPLYTYYTKKYLGTR